jgi:SAM-dependent MidA family methyltransferase
MQLFIMCLTSIIRDRIEREGPISFRDFMEMALYHPTEGYYTSTAERIGLQGDFYTSAYLTSLFGKLIAKQLEEMWRILGKGEFTIIEFGAGSGLLCSDILEQIKENREFYKAVNYCIIEKSGAMRKKQQSLLHDRVKWYNNVDDIDPVTGCVISNEVVDNFAVHQVMMREQLNEIFVGYENGFVELLLPASKSLTEYFDELKVSLPNGFRTEINLEAIKWITQIAHVLKKGFVLTIDYGFPSLELYSDRRRLGTMVCYHKHKVNYSPYENIGQQDITTHINFSALHHWGTKAGLDFGGFTNQAYFLMGLGFTSQIGSMERGRDNGIQDRSLLLQTFLRDMGRRMKVLVQQKNIGRVPLSGLQFSERL